MSLDDRSAIVRELAKKMRRVERSRQPGSAGLVTAVNSFADVESFAEQKREASVSTGIGVLDQMLPDTGFLKGTIVEWICDSVGSGGQTLAMLSAASILQHRVRVGESQGRTLMVVDAANDFYPVAAARLGIDLKRTVVVRPNLSNTNAAQAGVKQQARTSSNNDVLWTLEQSLRSNAIGLTMCAIDHLNGHTFRRLQLAAQAGGGLCFLRRPLAAVRQPTWADVRLRVRSVSSEAIDISPLEKMGGRRRAEVEPREAGSQSANAGRLASDAPRRLTIELLKCRAGLSGDKVEVDYHDETNDVRVAAELARPAVVHHAS